MERQKTHVESDVHVPVLPLEAVPLHRKRDALWLLNVERLDVPP